MRCMRNRTIRLSNFRPFTEMRKTVRRTDLGWVEKNRRSELVVKICRYRYKYWCRYIDIGVGIDRDIDIEVDRYRCIQMEILSQQ